MTICDRIQFFFKQLTCTHSWIALDKQHSLEFLGLYDQQRYCKKCKKSSYIFKGTP